jgi:predicted nucleotidyltransferase
VNPPNHKAPGLEGLTTALARQPEVRFAFLFGSRATAKARPDSDWDVAVYVDEGLDDPQRFDLRLRLTVELAEYDPLDLVVLNDAPPLLGHRALMGRRLFVKDKTAYVRFFVRTLAESWDEAYCRQVHGAARYRRLEQGRYGRP